MKVFHLYLAMILHVINSFFFKVSIGIMINLSSLIEQIVISCSNYILDSFSKELFLGKTIMMLNKLGGWHSSQLLLLW